MNTAPTLMSIGARIAMIIFTLGFVINLIETWYFGWNWSAGVTTSGERLWDAISSFSILIGLGMMIYYRTWGNG